MRRATGSSRGSRTLRRRLVNYAAAVAINFDLISRGPAARAEIAPVPYTREWQGALVEGRWDRREMIAGPRGGILVQEWSVADDVERDSVVGWN